MSLVRRLARPALAATFVSGGLRSLRHPEVSAPATEQVAARVSAVLRRGLPAQLAGRVPTETVQLVRLNGAISLAGGLLLAVGKSPRPAAVALAATLVPTTAARYPFWSDTDPALKAQHRTHFVQSVGLLGGLLLAAVDTGGRPGLSWRAGQASREVGRGARRQARRAGTAAKVARGTAVAARTTAATTARTGAAIATRQARAQARAVRRTGRVARGLAGAAAAKAVVSS